MSKPPRAKYRTTNWSEYNAALKRRGSFMVWLAADLQWQALASSRSGRPAVFSDAAIQFCLTLKFMFGLALRQATGLAESLLKLAHLDWAVPDYSTLSRRQKTLSVAIATRRSSAGLHLLIGRTGVKMLGEGEWKTKKHGADYRQQWRKVHMGIDAQMGISGHRDRFLAGPESPVTAAERWRTSACWCFIHPMRVACPGFCQRQACPHQGSTCARSETSFVSNSKPASPINGSRLQSASPRASWPSTSALPASRAWTGPPFKRSATRHWSVASCKAGWTALALRAARLRPRAPGAEAQGHDPHAKVIPMMMNTPLDQLRSLKLLGMAAGLQDQLTSAGMTAMSFE